MNHQAGVRISTRTRITQLSFVVDDGVGYTYTVRMMLGVGDASKCD